MPPVVTEDSTVILLAKRIQVLISVAGLRRDECHETIMSAPNPPTEEEFRLGWNAAWLLHIQLNREYGIELTPE